MHQAYSNIRKLLAQYGVTIESIVDEILFVTNMDAAFAAAVKCRQDIFSGTVVASTIVQIQVSFLPNLFLILKKYVKVTMLESSLIHWEQESVHLLGAAVDDEQVSTRPDDFILNKPQLPCSGKAIDGEVGRFFNLCNPEENMLQYVYNSVEGDEALGWCGEEEGSQWFAQWWCFIGNRASEPRNYGEYGIIDELPSNQDSNNDGECDVRRCDKYFLLL
jgi:hypothetical protein